MKLNIIKSATKCSNSGSGILDIWDEYECELIGQEIRRVCQIKDKKFLISDLSALMLKED